MELHDEILNYLRKASLLLLSVLLLYLLLLFFTSLSFLHSYTSYVSIFLLPYIAHTLERKYMFLLCNGILVFLARKSGFRCLPSAELQTEEVEVETDDVLHQKIVNAIKDDIVMLQPAGAEPVEPSYEAAAKDEEIETRAGEKEDNPVLDGTVADLTEDAELCDEAIEKENEQESGLIVGEEDDGESEATPSNTEELNKKVEEFIRKMKEELKIEAQQQQLIAA